MTEEVCYGLLCFVPLDAGVGAEIFGFSEFITALALLVVLYTIADIRFKFRLAITPGALYPVTYALIAIIGIVTLLTEVWLAEGWWVPRTVGITTPIWQAMFGLLFLGAFLTWMYYAFIRPPVFCKRNAERYAQTLFRLVLKGNDAELAVIANELARSAMPLVKLSRRLSPRSRGQAEAEETKKQKPCAGDFAYDLLLLIANTKLCRHIVESSPVTALAFFEAMTDEKKYDIPIGLFARNISTEAIANKDSILYEEADSFSSGLIGHLKPWSQTIYGNFELIEALAANFESPLDIDYRALGSWDAEQWEAYCRVTLVSLKAWLTSNKSNTHSYAVYRALHEVENAFHDLYELSETTDELHENDAYQRLRVAVNFTTDAVDLIDEQTSPPLTKLHRRQGHHRDDIYDILAHLIFKIVDAASSVSGPPDRCWVIHHNATWGMFFDHHTSKAWKIIRFKVRRLLYDEVAQRVLPQYNVL